MVVGVVEDLVDGVVVGAVVGVATGAVVGVATGAVVGVATGAVVGVATGAVVGVATGAVVGVATGAVVGTVVGVVVGFVAVQTCDSLDVAQFPELPWQMNMFPALGHSVPVIKVKFKIITILQDIALDIYLSNTPSICQCSLNIREESHIYW